MRSGAPGQALRAGKVVAGSRYSRRRCPRSELAPGEGKGKALEEGCSSTRLGRDGRALTSADWTNAAAARRCRADRGGRTALNTSVAGTAGPAESHCLPEAGPELVARLMGEMRRLQHSAPWARLGDVRERKVLGHMQMGRHRAREWS